MRCTDTKEIQITIRECTIAPVQHTRISFVLMYRLVCLCAMVKGYMDSTYGTNSTVSRTPFSVPIALTIELERTGIKWITTPTPTVDTCSVDGRFSARPLGPPKLAFRLDNRAQVWVRRARRDARLAPVTVTSITAPATATSCATCPPAPTRSPLCSHMCDSCTCDSQCTQQRWAGSVDGSGPRLPATCCNSRGG